MMPPLLTHDPKIKTRFSAQNHSFLRSFTHHWARRQSIESSEEDWAEMTFPVTAGKKLHVDLFKGRFRVSGIPWSGPKPFPILVFRKSVERPPVKELRNFNKISC